LSGDILCVFAHSHKYRASLAVIFPIRFGMRPTEMIIPANRI
jgi:hypothetical protein